jgi:hypothetical protein
MIKQEIIWHDAMKEHPWHIGLELKEIKYVAYMSKGYLFSANFDGTHFFLSSGGIFGPREGDMYAILEPPVKEK